MADIHFSHIFLLISLLSFFYPQQIYCQGSVGINYGRLANNLPQPPQVAQLVKSTGLTRVKTFDVDPGVLNAFAGTNISVTVCMPNQELAKAGGDPAYADTWVKTNILAFYPKTKIEAIAVGNEVFAANDNGMTSALVPAMKNLVAALQKAKVGQAIKVSSPIALGVLGTSYPPSAGSFKPEYVPVMTAMLDLIKQSGSYLMVNVYPFFAYAANTDVISLDYALFRDTKGNKDANSGLVYKNLFDAQVDAIYASMNALKFTDINLEITESGWPSIGDANEAGAGLANAAAYNGGLVRRVLTGGGTPLRPKSPLNVVLFALFNENQKTGPTSERNYGLFYPNQQKVYNIPLTRGDLDKTPATTTPAATTPTGPPATATPATPATTTTPAGGSTWCVANAAVGNDKIQKALDWACGEGGADCKAIQPGGPCNANPLDQRASYAFNSYYQKNGRSTWTCDFGGCGRIVSEKPKLGSCVLPP